MDVTKLNKRWTAHYEITVLRGGGSNWGKLYPNKSVELGPDSTKEEALEALEQLLMSEYPTCTDIIVKSCSAKVVMPHQIREKMKLWREGLLGEMTGEWGFPKDYIQFHTQLAQLSLDEMVDAGWRVHSRWYASDGWGDGFQIVWAVVENIPGELFKIHWSDSNQGWMQKYTSGGSGYFDTGRMLEWTRN